VWGTLTHTLRSRRQSPALDREPHLEHDHDDSSQPVSS
jgi:branched-chain amino acid transport system permease protein